MVLKPVANMYAQPADDTEVVSQAIYGTNVGVVETRAGWLRVRTPDDYTGWMPQRRLAPAGRRRAALCASQGRVARVESLFANIYREPNVTRRRPLITVPFETRLEVIAEPQDNTRWLESPPARRSLRLAAARRRFLRHSSRFRSRRRSN